VTLSSFLSYAVYDVSRDAAGARDGAGVGCTGDDVVLNKEGPGDAVNDGMDAAGGGVEAAGVDPNNPSMSSTVDLAAVGAGEFGEGWDGEEPNISASRS
jgi:hypothetical protein